MCLQFYQPKTSTKVSQWNDTKFTFANLNEKPQFQTLNVKVGFPTIAIKEKWDKRSSNILLDNECL